jgi:hypothetical protein
MSKYYTHHEFDEMTLVMTNTALDNVLNILLFTFCYSQG